MRERGESKAIAARAPLWVGRAIIARLGKRLRDALADADVVFAYCLSVFLTAIIGKWVGFSEALAAGATNLFDVADINAGEALALCAMLSIVLDARRTLSLTLADFCVIVAAVLFFLPPSPQNLPFVGATLAGAYFWRTRREMPALASLGQIWIAISAHAAWGPLVFRILSAPILRLETVVIAHLGHDAGLGLTVRDAELTAPSGWSVYILAPCSSFHNLSLAALVWLSLLKLGREPIRAPAWAALFTGAALIMMLNVTRILLMTPSEAHYHYWHDGLGRSLFICLTFAAIALPTLLSMRSVRQSQSSAMQR